MIHLCREPDCPLDIISPALAKAITELGYPAKESVIGRDNVLSWTNKLPANVKHFVFSHLQTRWLGRTAVAAIRAGDTVIVYETASIATRSGDASFQRRAKQRGAFYVPVFPDAWILTHGWLHDCCKRRVELADCVGCVTPELVRIFHDAFPQKRIELMEESGPVADCPPTWTGQERTVIGWSGPPHKIDEVINLLPVLNKVYHEHPFVLRIVSGLKAPGIKTDIPIEWKPFSKDQIVADFQDVSIAFAQYPNTPYGRCKGNYKIKTYLSAGCAIVSNPIGYNQELIQPGINGLFANTSEEWKSSFLRLLRNADERLSMRKASRELAVRRFSYLAIAKQYVDVLTKLGMPNHNYIPS